VTTTPEQAVLDRMLGLIDAWESKADQRSVFLRCYWTTSVDPSGLVLTNWHCIGHTDLYGEDDTASRSSRARKAGAFDPLPPTPSTARACTPARRRHL
jgi:hypothetical protein